MSSVPSACLRQSKLFATKNGLTRSSRTLRLPYRVCVCGLRSLYKTCVSLACAKFAQKLPRPTTIVGAGLVSISSNQLASTNYAHATSRSTAPPSCSSNVPSVECAKISQNCTKTSLLPMFCSLLFFFDGWTVKFGYHEENILSPNKQKKNRKTLTSSHNK